MYLQKFANNSKLFFSHTFLAPPGLYCRGFDQMKHPEFLQNYSCQTSRCSHQPRVAILKLPWHTVSWLNSKVTFFRSKAPLNWGVKMPKIERRHSLVLHQLIQGGIFFAFSISGGHWERQAYFRGAFFSAFSSSGGLFLGMMMFNKNARKKSGGLLTYAKFSGGLFLIILSW